MAALRELGFALDDEQVDINYFYRTLIRYGHWVLLSAYGWVWLPNDIPAGWRPYTLGPWGLTDYGWTWFSSERSAGRAATPS